MLSLQWLLKEKRLDGVSNGSPEWFNLQRDLVLSRPLLRSHYDLWYSKMLRDESTVPKDQPGQILEIGSGGGYIKLLRRDIITSDVIPGLADKVVDARALPFPDQSLRAIFLTNSFHHIPDVETFLREAVRTLVPGGVVSLVDPAATPLARLFFTHFHPEPFEADSKDWTFNSNHNMESSNQALSWIVFKRDQNRLKTILPHLQVERTEFLPWFSYIATGGVTRRNLVPALAVPFFKLIDYLTTPLFPLASLNWHLTLRKTN